MAQVGTGTNAIMGKEWGSRMGELTKLEFYVCGCRDARGHECFAIGEEQGTTIQLWGIDSKGERQSFEAEMYHAENWCKMHKFYYRQEKRHCQFSI